MSQTERLYRLKSLLDTGRCLTKTRLLEELAISPATLKRDIAHLRDRMNAPVIFDHERKGWRLDRDASVVGTQYELPGLWLRAEEIHALLTMQHRAWIETARSARGGGPCRVARASRRVRGLKQVENGLADLLEVSRAP